MALPSCKLYLYLSQQQLLQNVSTRTTPGRVDDGVLDRAVHVRPSNEARRPVHLEQPRVARRVDGEVQAHDLRRSCRARPLKIVAPGEVLSYRKEAGSEILTIRDETGASRDLPFGKFIMALGFISDLGPMEAWGLGIDGYRIPVKPDMETQLPRVFAIGDVSEYPGKVRLMAVGFGEAAIAVNHAAAAINPGMSVLPGHSTNEV